MNDGALQGQGLKFSLVYDPEESWKVQETSRRCLYQRAKKVMFDSRVPKT